MRSGVCWPFVPVRYRLGVSQHLFSFGFRLIDIADHVEGLLWQMVILARDQAFECRDRVFEFHLHARRTGEDFSHIERLRQEALNLTGTSHGQFVVFRAGSVRSSAGTYTA